VVCRHGNGLTAPLAQFATGLAFPGALPAPGLSLGLGLEAARTEACAE